MILQFWVSSTKDKIFTIRNSKRNFRNESIISPFNLTLNAICSTIFCKCLYAMLTSLTNIGQL